MQLPPEMEQKVIAETARLIVEELRKTVDFEDLITLPLSVAAQMIGRSSKQTARLIPTRPMGNRSLGVSLKSLKAYQNGSSLGRPSAVSRSPQDG